VVIALATLLYSRIAQTKGWKFIENGYGYYLLAGVCWGTVMWLFEKDKGLLQPSLRHSMEFLYKESDQVGGWTDFIPYYPKNKPKKGKRESEVISPSK
jgi:hypothetical protein